MQDAELENDLPLTLSFDQLYKITTTIVINNNNNRITATLYSLGTYFVSGI